MLLAFDLSWAVQGQVIVFLNALSAPASTPEDGPRPIKRSIR